jgi:antitoxin VapB
MRAKLFRNGRSQAVRLPACFRFEGTEVNIHRDAESGAVVLSPVRSSPLDWLRQRAELLDRDANARAEFDALFEDIDNQEPPQERNWL